MFVAEVFAREHSLFRAFLDRLELDLAQTEERARADIDEALRVLLPALDRHEEIEDLVFRHPPDGTGDPGQAMEEVAAQHRKLAALRNEILLALEESMEELPLEEIRALTRTLITDLRAHLQTEETRLWPLYRAALAQPLDAVVPVHLERRALALEEGLAKGITAISRAGPLGSGGTKPRKS